MRASLLPEIYLYLSIYLNISDYLSPVSDFKGLPYLLRQGELLRLDREPQKWILRPIWGLVGYTQGSAVYHP